MDETDDEYNDGCAVAWLFFVITDIFIAVGLIFCFGGCCRVDRGSCSGEINQKEEETIQTPVSANHD